MNQARPELYNKLSSSILRRYQANSRKSMLDVYQVDRDFVRLEKDTLEFMYANRVEITDILEHPDLSFDLAREFVRSSLEFTYNNNQYINLNEDEQERLLKLYHAYLQGMKTVLVDSRNFNEFEQNFTALVKEHFKDLSQNISRFFDREPGWQVQENIILKQVVCSEYTPDFQLGLLGMDAKNLMSPVLDLGCGKQGILVTYLRSLGHQAFGVDRIVEQVPGLREADWFDLEFKPSSWGTVISHMAFSNHFLFHHRYKNGNPTRYAQMYMQVLNGLKPGGRFIYSPGLPFIEQYLPEESFSIQRRVISDAPQLSEEIITDPGEKPYVVTVTRVG
jgi:SAM-dependent methyltransferase